MMAENNQAALAVCAQTKVIFPFNYFISKAINEGYRLGTLSVTQGQGLVTCIPKGEKSKQ